MTDHPAHHEVRALILAAGGSDEQVDMAIDQIGPARAAGLLADELVSRADLAEIPELVAIPILVRLELRYRGSAVRWHIRAAKVTEHVPEPEEQPHATVAVDLADLLRAVYGPRQGAAEPALVITWHDLEDPARLGAAMHVFPVVQHLLRGTRDQQADLGELSLRNGSDKWGLHYYTPHYERHFGPWRDRSLTILELGIGGFGNPASGGGSLRMWKRFFPRAVLYGVDFFDKAAIREQRLHTIQGDLSDEGFLASLGAEFGPFDIVIDDGSHHNPDVIRAFRTLFGHVRTGGLYVVEDLQTSYWPGYGGSSTRLDDPATSMGFLKRLVDGLNYEDREQGAAPQPTDATITGAHFYRSLAIFEKGVNVEGPSPSWVPRRLMTREQMSEVDWGEGLTTDKD